LSTQAYVLRHKDAAGVNFSTLLLMYQNVCGIALYFPADMLGFQTFRFFDWRSAWLMLPNSALFAVMVYSSAQVRVCRAFRCPTDASLPRRITIDPAGSSASSPAAAPPWSARQHCDPTPPRAAARQSARCRSP